MPALLRATSLFLALALSACPNPDDFTGATTGGPTTGLACGDCPVAAACNASAADFCWAVADMAAEHQIGEPHASALQDMCQTSPACQTCWNLEKYCVELADDVETCKDIAAECGCQAHAFGKV